MTKKKFEKYHVPDKRKETEHTDPVLFPSNHGPEAIPQTSSILHGAHQSVPRLVRSVHVPSPNINEVIQGHVIQRHIVSSTIQLVLVESH